MEVCAPDLTGKRLGGGQGAKEEAQGGGEHAVDRGAAGGAAAPLCRREGAAAGGERRAAGGGGAKRGAGRGAELRRSPCVRETAWSRLLSCVCLLSFFSHRFFDFLLFHFKEVKLRFKRSFLNSSAVRELLLFKFFCSREVSVFIYFSV